MCPLWKHFRFWKYLDVKLFEKSNDKGCFYMSMRKFFTGKVDLLPVLVVISGATVFLLLGVLGEKSCGMISDP